MQHPETLFFRWVCSFEECLNRAGNRAFPHREAQTQTRRLLEKLFEVWTPDAQSTKIQKMKKIIDTDYRVWSFTQIRLPLPRALNSGPPTRSRYEEQFMGVLQPHDWQRSQSADELQTGPREAFSVACRTQHPSALLRPTGSLSNVLGTSQRRCSTSVSLSPLSLSPFMTAPHYLYWCSLCFPPSPLLS